MIRQHWGTNNPTTEVFTATEHQSRGSLSNNDNGMLAWVLQDTNSVSSGGFGYYTDFSIFDEARLAQQWHMSWTVNAVAQLREQTRSG